jgi:pimeloyl-ACP methyl ester carboxylesterase
VINLETYDKKKISHFTSSNNQEKYYAAYNATLEQWPVEFTTVTLETRYGSTHVISCGPEDGPPLVLLAAAGLSGTLWIHNIAELSVKFRVHVIDIIVEPGKSIQTRPLESREDAGEWLIEVFDELGLEQANLAGISFGGWVSLNFALHAPNRVNKLLLLAPAASFSKFNRSILLSLKFGRFQWILPTKLTTSSLNLLTTKKEMLNKTFVNQFGLGIKYFRYPKGSVFPSVFTDEELSSLRTPTLLLLGDKEVIYDPRKALQRAERLIPEITSRLIPDAGHLLNVDQPSLLADGLIEFIIG